MLLFPGSPATPVSCQPYRASTRRVVLHPPRQLCSPPAVWCIPGSTPNTINTPETAGSASYPSHATRLLPLPTLVDSQAVQLPMSGLLPSPSTTLAPPATCHSPMRCFRPSHTSTVPPRLQLRLWITSHPLQSPSTAVLTQALVKPASALSMVNASSSIASVVTPNSTVSPAPSVVYFQLIPYLSIIGVIFPGLPPRAQCSIITSDTDFTFAFHYFYLS